MDIYEILKKADDLFAQSKSAEAMEYLEESLELALGSGQWKVALSIINELMGCYRNRSNYDKATELSTQALEIVNAHDIGYSIDAATTYMNIATLLREKGDLEKALQLFEKVEKTYLTHGLEVDTRMAGLYNNMSVIYIQTGDEAKAFEYASKAIKILEKIEDSADQRATVYCNIAQALSISPSGNPDSVNEYLDKAYDIFANECPGSVHFSAFWGLKGKLFVDRGDYEGAIESFRKAQEEIEKHFGKNNDYKIMEENIRLLNERLNK